MGAAADDEGPHGTIRRQPRLRQRPRKQRPGPGRPVGENAIEFLAGQPHRAVPAQRGHGDLGLRQPGEVLLGAAHLVAQGRQQRPVGLGAQGGGQGRVVAVEECAQPRQDPSVHVIAAERAVRMIGHDYGRPGLGATQHGDLHGTAARVDDDAGAAGRQPAAARGVENRGDGFGDQRRVRQPQGTGGHGHRGAQPLHRSQRHDARDRLRRLHVEVPGMREGQRQHRHEQLRRIPLDSPIPQSRGQHRRQGRSGVRRRIPRTGGQCSGAGARAVPVEAHRCGKRRRAVEKHRLRPAVPAPNARRDRRGADVEGESAGHGVTSPRRRGATSSRGPPRRPR